MTAAFDSDLELLAAQFVGVVHWAAFFFGTLSAFRRVQKSSTLIGTLSIRFSNSNQSLYINQSKFSCTGSPCSTNHLNINKVR